MTEEGILVNHVQDMVNEMRRQLLQLLRSRGVPMSGTELGRELGISRVAVWKHVRDLLAHGYSIERSTQGYQLVGSPDLLVPWELKQRHGKVHYFDEVGSTMDVARELARKGAEAGTVVVAEQQGKGKGRLGRSWLSPRGGIYFSLVLRPPISPVHAAKMMLMASVAVAQAIRKELGLPAELKWPNDVLISGRKVCGILAEMAAEADAVTFVVLGIGINVNAPVAEERATSLHEELGRDVSRSRLLDCILDEIERLEGVLGSGEVLERWKSLSATIGRRVRIVGPEGEIEGQAVDIERGGELMVRESDGSLRPVVTGDCFHV